MKLSKNILALLLVFITSLQLKGQSGTSLYHLTNGTFQGSYFNPAFFPEGKFFLGLPVVSGIGLDINLPASYNDLTIKQGDSTLLDLDGFANNTKFRNFISLEAEINTLHVGFRPTKTVGLSFSIRERMGARLYYGPDLIKLFVRGNENFINESIDLNPSLLDVRYYREYGFGIWKSLPKRGINVGGRIKFINGMFAAVTDRKFDGSISVSQDYEHDFFLRGAVLNTSGFDLPESQLTSHLISNGNIGVGVDMGAHWRINEYFSAAASVNDLGFINWKVAPENHYIPDTSFVFNGIGDLKDIQDFGQAFEDSLVQRFPDSTRKESFITGLNTTAYGSVIFQPTPKDQVIGTISSHIVRNQYRMIYAVGYTRQITTNLKVSGNVSRIPQQGIDFGLGLVANAGPAQFYLAADKLVNVWNLPEFKGANFRFGVNMVFGRRKEVKDDRSDLQHPSPYSKKSKIEKSDGIYWIIPKRKPRPIYEHRKKSREGKDVQAAPHIPSESGTQKRRGLFNLF